MATWPQNVYSGQLAGHAGFRNSSRFGSVLHCSNKVRGNVAAAAAERVVMLTLSKVNLSSV